MANTYVNKVQLADGTSLIDISDTTATASDVLTGRYFYTASGQKVQGSNQGGSGDGYVWQDANGYVHLSDEQGTQITVDSLTITSGGTYTAPTGHAYSPVTVASGTAGTPSASKGTVSSHSISVTPSVTNTAGYISSGTITGTAVTVSASELVSGTYSVTSSGTKDVTNYASASVPALTLPSDPSASSSGTYKTTISRSNLTRYLNIPTGYNDTASYYIISPVTLDSETITSNGTYIAADADLDGYSSVTVAVPTVTITQSGSNLSIT